MFLLRIHKRNDGMIHRTPTRELFSGCLPIPAGVPSNRFFDPMDGFMRIFQYIVFIALISVSAFFTLNLALGLGTTPAEKGALVAGSLALEGLKAFALVSANTAAVGGRWRKGIGLYFAYAFVGAYSLIACLGFSLATVDRMGAVTRVLDHEPSITAGKATVDDCGEQIKILRAQIYQQQATIARMNPLKQGAQKGQARKAISESLARIDGNIDRRREALERIEVWRAQDQAARAGARRSLYDIIGEALGVPGSRVAFLVLALFSLAIELGVFLTSPHAKPESTDAQQGKTNSRSGGHYLHPIRWILGLLGPTMPTDILIQTRVRERRPCRSPSMGSTLG